MTLGAKIITALSALCFLLWGAALSLGVQPLVPAAELEIVYGHHEDFFSDGAAFRKLRNTSLYLVHLPRADEQHRWWTVDLRDLTIAGIRPPRSLAGWRYLLQGDLNGISIGSEDRPERWLWTFTGDGAAFAGSALSCRVRKAN